jgi:hypothetical protein
MFQLCVWAGSGHHSHRDWEHCLGSADPRHGGCDPSLCQHRFSGVSNIGCFPYVHYLGGSLHCIFGPSRHAQSEQRKFDCRRRSVCRREKGERKVMERQNKITKTNAGWLSPFRCRGSRHEPAVAQLSASGIKQDGRSQKCRRTRGNAGQSPSRRRRAKIQEFSSPTNRDGRTAKCKAAGCSQRFSFFRPVHDVENRLVGEFAGSFPIKPPA